MRDPVQQWRRRLVAVVVVAAAPIAIAAECALRPLPSIGAPVIHLPPSPSTPADSRSHAPLDLAAFEARIWAPPPTEALDPDAAETDNFIPEPEPDLDLELIGITAVDGTRVAAVYDRAADRVHLVQDGDALLGRIVALAERRLDLVDEHGRSLQVALAGGGR